MPKQVIKRFSINQIKETAQNRIREILEHVAGIPVELLDEKNHPCPACGGKDRFRLINAGTGAVFCNQCFAKGNGDFIAAVQHYRRVDLPEALRLIADYLGIQAESPTSTNETTPKKPTGTWVYFEPQRIVLTRGWDRTESGLNLVEKILALYQGIRPDTLPEDCSNISHPKVSISGTTPFEQHVAGKRTLVIGEHRSAVRLSSEKGNTCPNYWHFSLYGFCPFNCSYCYLALNQAIPARS